MSIASPHGPIARAYASALRWAHAAEQRRYDSPQMRALADRLWRKVRGIGRILGTHYVPHPMDPWHRHSLYGCHGNRFRRRWHALPEEARRREMRPSRWGLRAWEYLTMSAPRAAGEV